MTDAPTSKRRFARIYFDDLEKDYPEVWFDPTGLSTFVRLLALSEKAWPGLPEFPRAVRRSDLALLERLGLVTPTDHNRYSMKGWGQEREARASKARDSVRSRYDRSTTVERTYNERTTAPARPLVSVSASTSSNGVGSGEGDPADAYWSLTGKYPTDKVLAWLDDLTAKFGAEAATRALAQAHIADAATSTLLGRAQDQLRSEARGLDRKEQEAEKERLREKRAIPKVIPAWETEFRAALEAKYGATQ